MTMAKKAKRRKFAQRTVFLLLVFGICLTNPDTFICAVQSHHPKPCLAFIAEHHTHFDFVTGETEYTDFYFSTADHYHDYPHYNVHEVLAQSRTEWIIMNWRHLSKRVTRKQKKILLALAIVVPVFAYTVWALVFVEEKNAYDTQAYLDRRTRHSARSMRF